MLSARARSVTARFPWLVAPLLVAFSPAPARSQGVADDRVYTAAQAAEGERLYVTACAGCHGAQLEGGGAPPLSGLGFLASWGRPDRSLDDLLFVISTIMPPGRARTLTAEQHASVLAYILQRNGYAVNGG